MMINWHSCGQPPLVSRRFLPCAQRTCVLVVLLFATHPLNGLENQSSSLEFGVKNDHHTFKLELPEEYLEILERRMEEQVNLLRTRLSEPAAFQRKIRDVSLSEIVDLKRENLQFNIGKGRESPALAHFLWNDKRFGIVGSQIFDLSDATMMEPFLSGLPVENGDVVKPYIFEEAFFIAIFNKKSATLRLYLLKSPGWTTMVLIQRIVGKRIEDCEFFEHDGNLHMAMAMQSEADDSPQSQGMELVIFSWTGNTMDAIHHANVEDLRDIAVIGEEQTGDVHLVLLHKNSSIQLWRFDEDENPQLVDKDDIQVPRVLQLETLYQNGDWYILLGGSEKSHVFLQQGERLLLWQVLHHNITISETSWIRIYEKSGSMHSTIRLLFQPSYYEKTYSFEIFVLDSSDFFTNIHTATAASFQGSPKLSMAIAKDAHTILIFTVSANTGSEYYIEAFSLKLNSDVPSRSDPLVQCLSDVEQLIEQLQSTSKDRATELKKNLVHYKDDVNLDMVVTVNQVSSVTSSYGKIEVLHGFNEPYEKPDALASRIQNINGQMATISSGIDSLLTSDATSFNGRLTIRGPVSVEKATVSSLRTDAMNDKNWKTFMQQAWRYSQAELSLSGNVTIEKLFTENVTVLSTLGGSSPSSWLLKSGGKINGKVSAHNVIVEGNIDLGGSLNGVKLDEIVDATSPLSTISGVKNFSSITVSSFANVSSLNDRDFVGWANSALAQNNGEPCRIAGTVRVFGSVSVEDQVIADSINDVDVKEFSESVVDKNYNHVIDGTVTFTSHLVVDNTKVETLNDVRTDEVLSSTGDQTIKAKLKATETIEVLGNLQCEDINGVNFDDFVYANEETPQEIQSPVQFSRKVVTTSLDIVEGSLNGINVSAVLNPREIKIQSSVQINGDVSANEVKVKVVNGIELGKLRKRYWTKSTDQAVEATVSMPFEVTVEGNVSAKTFLGKFINEDFLLTRANQSLDVDVFFASDVVLQNVEVLNLTDISGVSLKAIEEDLVKKKGDFLIRGNKVFDDVHVNGDLTIGDTFNGLLVPNDIVLLNQHQTLTGISFADDVHASSDVFSRNGNITLHTIGEVVLDDFINSAALADEEALIEGLAEFQDHLDVDHVEVKHTINGIDVRKVLEKGMKFTGLSSLNLSHLTITGNVIFNGFVETVTLNGYDIDAEFDGIVNTSNPGIISGLKNTTMPVHGRDATIASFNQAPLDFSTILTVSTNQTITGNYELKEVTARNIDVKAINGRDLSEFVKTSKTDEIQIVKGYVEMDQLTVQAPLKIENRILNDCSIPEYLEVMQFKQFDSLRIENGSLIVEDTSESNPLLGKLVNKVLRTDKAQEVSGAVTFQADITVGNLDIPSNRVGKVDLGILFNGTMLKSGDQEVKSAVHYMGKVNIESVDHAKNVDVVNWNGADVQKVVEDVVVPGSSLEITATKTFLEDVVVKRRFEVTGDINGVKPAQLIKVTEVDKIPSVKFTSLRVANMTVRSGIIDGVNLNEVLRDRVPLDGNVSVESNIAFSGKVSAEHVTLKNVNKLDVSELVLKTASPGQTISGQKTLTKNLILMGDVSVSLLNGRNPEEAGAYVVLKDHDASFEYPLVFNGGVSVLEQVCVDTYEGENMTALLKSAPMTTHTDESAQSAYPPRALLTKLQRTRNHLADFQYFEQIQQESFNFPSGPTTSVRLQYCSIPTRKQNSTADTATGILIATHSSDGNSCGLTNRCRCHRSIVLPSDTAGRLSTVRTPTRLKEYLETKTHHGYRVRLLSSEDHLFVIAVESFPGCVSEKVSLAVFHPITFKMGLEQTVEVSDTILDVASETDDGGTVYFALMKSSSGVTIYSFDGHNFTHHQTIATPKAVALALVKHSEKLLLAVASYGLEAMSSVWAMDKDGQFGELKDLITVGATDVIFTKADGELYLTFAQDPSSVTPYTENWSQLKVPAQVFLYSRTTNTFDLVQQLDIDRVISLTNLAIHGEPFIAAASSNGKVRVYRLISGQGFLAEQTFKIPGIKSIVGYGVKNETYLATMTESKAAVHVARLRGVLKSLTMV